MVSDSGQVRSKHKKVLVVDDEEDVVIYLCTLLEEHGFETCSAANGIEAMRKVEEENPDLICLDILMPEKSGNALYQELKMDRRTRDVPVILVTGFKADDHPFLEFKRFLAGQSLQDPEGYVEKPIDREVLLDLVRKLTQD
jgi:CheY-like chemotaxis protein